MYSELANYLPVNKQSMKYCHNTQKEHLSQLHLFESSQFLRDQSLLLIFLHRV